MLETALLSSRSPVRAHAVRVSLPAIVALHGAVLAGFVVASAWNTGEPAEPSLPIVFGRLASLPQPRGDAGARRESPPVRSPRAARAQAQRLDLSREDPPASRTEAEDAPSTDVPASDDGSGTARGDRGGVEGGDGDVRDTGGSGDDRPLVPGGDVTYPVLVRRIAPDYPELARRARIEGVVVLDAIITAAGVVEEVIVVSSAHPLLDDAAARAVRQWTYRPATLNGRAVRVRLTVTINYSLRSA